jgi:hypothetical protein
MTAVRQDSSAYDPASDLRADGGRARRSWSPMTLEYVGHVGDVMKSTHKSGQMGESDIFSNHKV